MGSVTRLSFEFLGQLNMWMVFVCGCFPLASLTESCSLLDGLKDFFLLQKLSLTIKLITSEVVQGTSIRTSVYGMSSRVNGQNIKNADQILNTLHVY